MSLYRTSPYADADRREPIPPSSRRDPILRRQLYPTVSRIIEPSFFQHPREGNPLPATGDCMAPPPPYNEHIVNRNNTRRCSAPSVPATFRPNRLPLPAAPQVQADNNLIPYLSTYIALVNKINPLKHADIELRQQQCVQKESDKLKVLQDIQNREAKVERIKNMFCIVSMKAKISGHHNRVSEKEFSKFDEANAAVLAKQTALKEYKVLLEKAEAERERLSHLAVELQDSRLSLIKLLNTAFQFSSETNPSDYRLTLSLHHHNPFIVDLDSNVMSQKTALNLIMSVRDTLSKF
ncbi:hypothetical protein BC829DRAFT_278305 [Chytridium lagenaria]|nr:hypothetical protein BC829DRAFT_278305 [Chytridium lagenaria]